MAISTLEKRNLNRANKAMQDVSFGNVFDARGSYTAVSADDTAGTLDITTSFTDAEGFFVQIYRSGVDVTEDAIITYSAGILTVTDGGVTYAITAGDVITYMLV